MLNSNEKALLGKIELLEQRIQTLELQNESLRAGIDGSKLVIESNPIRQDSAKYFINFLSAAWFPIAAGIFRTIYKKIYGLKK